MEDWITQSEAAELRDLTVQVINNWVRRGRIRTTERYGKILVSRSDVLAYEPGKGGRPPKAKEAAKKTKAKKKPA
jgi:predicted site-specific integrase-resolvase